MHELAHLFVSVAEQGYAILLCKMDVLMSKLVVQGYFTFNNHRAAVEMLSYLLDKS